MSALNETYEYSDQHEPETHGMGARSNDPLLDRAKEESSNRSNSSRARRPSTDRNDAQRDAQRHEGQVGPDGQFFENPNSDEGLFRRYQQGEESAFLTLYDRYKSNIYAYCARAMYTAGMDEAQIEDTFQEVFLRIAQYQHTFVGGDFRAWLFTVTRHTCLIIKKKHVQERQRTERVGDPESFEDEVRLEVRKAFSINDDPLERMSMNEQTALLLKAIESLPETYREALILSDYEGMTYDEIGKLTGTSLSTIRIRIFRAKARLRKVLLPIIGDDIGAAATSQNLEE